MTIIKNITKYFRQSIIDSERLSPADKDLLPTLGIEKKVQKSTDYENIPIESWLSGRVDPSLAKKIVQSKQIKNRPPLREVEIVIFPRVDLLKSDGGAITESKRRVLLPLVVFVNLTIDGELKPSKKAPWIPREWLSPNNSNKDGIGEFSNVDKYITHNPFENVDTWEQLIKYSTSLLSMVTGKPCTNQSDSEEQLISIYDLELHSDFELSQFCLLQITPPIVGAKGKILKVLDLLIEEDAFPRLYQSYCNEISPKLIPYKNLENNINISKNHIAQMTGEFPLSPNQRNSLHHFIAQKNGEILTINGPPGTGKTTLLLSVVANLWTQAALDEAEAPLIVATSNNNQAVTNILESFAKIDEEGLDPKLKGRWIPEVDSYGLYCCAGSKANDKNNYMFNGPKDEGCMKKFQTQEYVDSASSEFLKKATSWHHSPVESIKDAKESLLKSLKSTKKEIAKGIDKLIIFLDKHDYIVSKYGNIESFNKSHDHIECTVESTKKDLALVKSQLKEFYLLWENRSLLIQLLMWIPPIRKQEYRKNRRLMLDWDVDCIHFDDDYIEALFLKKIEQLKSNISDNENKLRTTLKLLNEYQKAEFTLITWIEKHQPSKLNSSSFIDTVNEINDRVLRFKMFKIATHYWEARWLIEIKEFLDTNDSDKKSVIKVKRKLRRFSKITPCFVSTFYMVPSTFLAGSYTDNVWKDIPLFNEIDLLIVDEAGQALPEVSSASFSLAKRALIVGDTDQIEPVWSIPASIDRSNLQLHQLMNSEQEYQKWLDSGLLASSGNVMKVSQRQCLYHQFEELQRGLYLTEHRRCFDEIIEYCNKLVYKGILDSKRGSPKSVVPWGTMSMVPVYGPSKSYGGSRGNENEATEIASWLLQEKNVILDYAKANNPKWVNKTDEEIFSLSVGVITPFKKQASLIHNELRKQSIQKITVGTVHSLQGDERLIVLFSSVYGENDKDSGKFYDFSHNMLNVAVSRAKDSFIVFGHPDIFGMANKGTPSGMLRLSLSTI